MLALKALTYEELQLRLLELGLERYRTDQLVDWVYRRRVRDFDSMTNVPVAQRQLCRESFDLTPVEEAAHRTSAGDGTHKFLLRFRDGAAVETVLMPMHGHHTVCVSSQVGCRFACKFCLTARRGLVRDLTADEIVQQVLHVQPYVHSGGANIVFMGMGEPLDNFENVVQAIRVLSSPQLGSIGARRITVSTTGIPERIRELARLDLRVRLAVSLNASNDADRRFLMPVSGRHSLHETLAAAEAFARCTRHHVSLEYVLMHGVTDRLEDVRRLRKLGDPGGPFKLNLIPFNPDPRLRFTRPDPEHVLDFEKRLQGAFRSVTVRWSLGLDIDAACGQLLGRKPVAPQAG
ncbi:MAG: 23S rRNA (adenine(2503)-C(2))-methyltransferase RlmN [Candidatus Krumholzibacteriia bacterium]